MAGIGGGAPQNVRRFTDSTATLTANSTFTGTARSTDFFSRFRAKAVSDQAGTLYVDQSYDGSTWDNTITQPVAANTPTVVESICTDLNTRVRYLNGTTNQGSFRLTTALIAV